MKEAKNSVVAGALECFLAAPLVNVVTKEIDGLFGRSTVEVRGNLVSDVRIIIGSVAHAHGAIFLVLDVLLHISDSGLDVCGSRGRGSIVCDLVANEEADDIRVIGKRVDDLLEMGEQIDVPLRVLTIDRLPRITKIGNHIDARVVE